MKAKRMLAVLLAVILTFSNVWTVPAFAEEMEEVPEYRLENLRERDWTWIYNNEEMTIPLNMEGLEDVTDINWYVGVWNEETDETTLFTDMEGIDVEQLYTVSEDEQSITLYGEGFSDIASVLQENSWFNLSVDVLYGNEQNFSQGMGVELRQPKYEYQFPCMYPGENQMLVCDNQWINSNMSVRYEDSSEPYGMNSQVEITDVEIVKQYSWDEDGNEVEVPFEDREIICLEGNAEDGWDLRGSDHGFGDVEITYETVDGGEDTYAFRMYSVGEYYRLEKVYQNDNNNMLLESEMNVGVRVVRVYMNEDENHCEEEVSDYTVGLSTDDEGHPFYNTEVAAITIEGNEFVIKANSEHAYIEPWIYATGEFNGNEWYAETIMEVSITDMFYNIEPIDLVDENGERLNVELGEILDITHLENSPAIYRYEVGQEKVEVTENIRVRLEYDENVWQATEETVDELIPVLERIGANGGWICLIVEENLDAEGEEEDWSEIVRRNYWFEGLNYNVWFDNMQYGDWGYVYSEGETIFYLNTENLEGKSNYSVDFAIGRWVNDEFVAFEEEGLFDTVTDDAGNVTGIKLYGSAISSLDELQEDTWFEIQKTVTIGENIVFQETQGVELRRSGVDYQYRVGDATVLPGWSIGVSKYLHYYMENEEYPDGCEGEVEITDVKVKVTDGEKQSVVVREWEDGTGWEIFVNDFCSAVVTITHASAENPQEVETYSFNVQSVDELWGVELSTNIGVTAILPGGQIDLMADVQCDRYADGEYGKGDTSQVEIEWEYINENDEEYVVLEQDKDNQNILHLTANEDAECGREIGVRAKIYILDENGNRIQDESGNDVEVASNEIWIGIREEYFGMIPFSYDGIWATGDSIKFTPSLYRAYVDENGEMHTDAVTENVFFRVYWEEYNLEISTVEDGRIVILKPNESVEVEAGREYTFTRLDRWWYAFNIEAIRINENGDEELVTNYFVDVPEIDNNVYTEEELRAAVKSLYEWDTITLQKNIELTEEEPLVIDKPLTIDLNGHNIETNLGYEFVIFEAIEGAEFTITDWSEETGSVIGGMPIYLKDNAIVWIEGGRFEAEEWIIDGDTDATSEVYIKNGEFVSEFGVVSQLQNGYLCIEGGYFKAPSIIYLAGGKAGIMGGNLEATDGPVIEVIKRTDLEWEPTLNVGGGYLHTENKNEEKCIDAYALDRENNYAVSEWPDANVFLYGGELNREPDDAYISDACEKVLFDEENNLWGIQSKLDYDVDLSEVTGELQVGDTITVTTTVTNSTEETVEHVYVGLGCDDFMGESGWQEVLATESDDYETTENGAYISELKPGESVQVVFEKEVQLEWVDCEVNFVAGVFVLTDREMTAENLIFERTYRETTQVIESPVEYTYEILGNNVVESGNEVIFKGTVKNISDHVVEHVFVGMAGVIDYEGMEVFTNIVESDRYRIKNTDAYIHNLLPNETVEVTFRGIVPEEWAGKSITFMGVAQLATESNVESTVVFMEENIETYIYDSAENPFEDVNTTDYYYAPVLWALDEKITDGWTESQFAPNMGCTRGQVVTFLWRAAGEPKAKNAENPFKDVAENSYYYDAVLWAVEQGITDGWLADQFAPDMTCTRGQIVTFIWRAAGEPEAETDNCAFTDVAENAYYREAVLWAVENGITDGWLPTQFAPDMECTRGQVVTFLYRHYN